MNEVPFNPDMVRLARDLRGMTQKELSNRSGCTQGYLSQVENGLKEVTPERAGMLAQALAFPTDFFYQGHPYMGVGVSLVFYRKRQSALVSHVYRLQAEVAVRRLAMSKVLRAIEIGRTERSFRFMDIDDFDGKAEDIARLTRASWQLPAGPIPNLVNVIENAGGIVFKFSFGTKDIDAMSQWPDAMPPLFFINADAPADRVRFSLAHEIGHIVMHRSASDEMEHEADRFASELLMPSGIIDGDLIGFDLAKAAQLKPYWRVSMAALVKRARTLGVVSDDQYTKLWRTMSKYGYRKDEPVKIAPEEPRFVPELLRVYQSSLGVDFEGLARTVNLYLDDFAPRFLPRPDGLRLAM